MESSRLGRIPVPAADLILRVGESFGPDDIEPAQRALDHGGRNNLAMFERALAAVPKYRFGEDVWLDEDRAGEGRSLADSASRYWQRSCATRSEASATEA